MPFLPFIFDEPVEHIVDAVFEKIETAMGLSPHHVENVRAIALLSSLLMFFARFEKIYLGRRKTFDSPGRMQRRLCTSRKPVEALVDAVGL